jgi:hypothetical protein
LGHGIKGNLLQKEITAVFKIKKFEIGNQAILYLGKLLKNAI